MSEPTLDTYQSNYGEVPAARRWFVVALIFSLAFHAALLLIFNLTRLERFSPAPAQRLVPRIFTVNRVQIDPRVLNDSPEADKKVSEENRPPIPVQVPEDRPSAPTVPQEVKITPVAPELAKTIVSEKPKADAANLQTMAKLQKSASQEMDKEMEEMRQTLIKEAPTSSKTLVRTGNTDNPGAGSANTEGSKFATAIPGLASLDEALAGGGQYDPSKPIGIPGGALFEYDSAELKEAAISAMQKLNKLLTERFPNAAITIEGHTDSFGSPDYNLGLSQRRAEAVKNWLVKNYHIAPERLQTVGYGSTRLIVSGDKSVEEQAPNRRVEISIHTQ